jgi:hypothetical protein
MQEQHDVIINVGMINVTSPGNIGTAQDKIKIEQRQ